MYVKDIMITVQFCHIKKRSGDSCKFMEILLCLHVHIDVITLFFTIVPVGFQVNIGPQYTLLVEKGISFRYSLKTTRNVFLNLQSFMMASSAMNDISICAKYYQI